MIDAILSCVEFFKSKNRNCKSSSFIFIFEEKEKRIEKNKFHVFVWFRSKKKISPCPTDSEDEINEQYATESLLKSDLFGKVSILPSVGKGGVTSTLAGVKKEVGDLRAAKD